MTVMMGGRSFSFAFSFAAVFSEGLTVSVLDEVFNFSGFSVGLMLSVFCLTSCFFFDGGLSAVSVSMFSTIIAVSSSIELE